MSRFVSGIRDSQVDEKISVPVKTDTVYGRRLAEGQIQEARTPGRALALVGGNTVQMIRYPSGPPLSFGWSRSG